MGIGTEQIPLLSVIVPVRNMQGRLELVKTWLQDTKEFPIEVIFINDASSDDTLKELKKIILEVGHLSSFLHDGKFDGPGGARNVGLNNSHGEWITFWDSDDLPVVQEFIKMIISADQLGKDSAAGSWIAVPFKQQINSQNGDSRKKITHPSLLRIVKSPGLWRWAFRSELLLEKKFPEIRMGEDQVFLSNLNIKLANVYLYHHPVYNYSFEAVNQLTTNSKALSERVFMATALEPISLSIKNLSLLSFLLQVKIRLSVIFNRFRDA